MKIVTLIENTTADESLACEHGLSLYIEACGRRILFDTGASGGFADNAEKLGVDLTQVDFAVLSHGHSDHGGGLHRFLECNRTAPIYMSRHGFLPLFNALGDYIGLDTTLKMSDRIIFTDGCMSLDRGLTLYSCNNDRLQYPLDTASLQMEVDGVRQPEDFRHEQYLLIEEGGKRICISGCSHKGILNIAGWFKPDVLVGGFHFFKLATEGPDARILDRAAKVLKAQPAVYYTGHCTGIAQYHYLKERMADQLHAIQTGTVITL